LDTESGPTSNPGHAPCELSLTDVNVALAPEVPNLLVVCV